MNLYTRIIIVTLFMALLSTASAVNKIFPEDAVINVCKAPYNAKPNDGIDDTSAIQKAITENIGKGKTLYFPNGTYNISDTLIWKNRENHWEPHLTLQGENQDRTILKLKNSCNGFDNPEKPKAVIATGSLWQQGDALNGAGNKAFRNSILDMTIDAGRKNHGAIGISYAVSNQGTIKDVTINGDGQTGISFHRKLPGPGLIKNVKINGFGVGIDLTDIQYGITIENVTVSNQKIAGIRNSKNLLHIRKLYAENCKTAILGTENQGMITLIDSDLGDASIETKGTLTINNTKHGKIICETDFLTNSANLLPIEETPVFWNDNINDWIAVGQRLEGEHDDTKAIQRAIDSGKSTIYLINNRDYFISDTVVIRGKIKQIMGMGAEISLGASKDNFSNTSSPRPLIRIDDTVSPTVFFENMFFNAQYPGEVIFENNTDKTVVIKHCAGWVGSNGHRESYRNTNLATGKVFIEDVFLPGWNFKNQKVWARQFNPENLNSDGSKAQVINDGSDLWILGFKTEGTAPFILTKNGGRTELLGAYNYVSAIDHPIIPEYSVPYILESGEMALTFASDNFKNSDYKYYIQDTEQRTSKEIRQKDVYRPCDTSFVVPLYRSKR